MEAPAPSGLDLHQVRGISWPMGLFADLAILRRERALAARFRTATPTLMEGPATDDAHLRLHLLLDRGRLPLIRCPLAAARAVAAYMFEQRKHEEVGFWANRHRTVVTLAATPEDMAEMAAYFAKLGKTALLWNDEALDERPVAAVFEPLPAMEGRVLFGRFQAIAL